MVRKKIWLLGGFFLISCSSAMGDDKQFVSITGQQMTLSIKNGECAFSMEGSDVYRKGNCSLKNTERLRMTTTVLSFDFPVSALRIGITGYIDDETDNKVDYVKDFSMLGKELDDVFLIHSIRADYYAAQFSTLYSLEHGIIGFQKLVPEGPGSFWMVKEL